MTNRSMRVFIVEHGETRWSRLNVFISRTDLELSDTGKQQMSNTGRLLRNESFSSVYTTGMRRTDLSARLIVPGMRVKQIPELREMDYGTWEGLSVHQIRREQPMAWEDYEAGGPPPQGERYETFYRRISSAVASILMEQTEDNCQILIVTDPMSTKAVIASLLELPYEAMWRFRTHPGCVATIETGGGFSMLTRLT